MIPADIPSPTAGVLHLGPLPIRGYALCILLGIVVAIWLTDRRMRTRGGEPGQVLDVAAGALPGLSAPAAAEFVVAAGGTAKAKFGWTDVSRFAALGIPAVNYGPGDPALAHTREEWVSMTQIREMTEVLRSFLR